MEAVIDAVWKKQGLGKLTPEQIEFNVERIDIWIRLWGEGLGVPKEVWTNERVQYECIHMMDGVGIVDALCYLGNNHVPYEVSRRLREPLHMLEILTIMDRVRREAEE